MEGNGRAYQITLWEIPRESVVFTIWRFDSLTSTSGEWKQGVPPDLLFRSAVIDSGELFMSEHDELKPEGALYGELTARSLGAVLRSLGESLERTFGPDDGRIESIVEATRKHLRDVETTLNLEKLLSLAPRRGE